MIRLNLSSKGPSWLELGLGVRVQVQPLTSVLVGAASSDPRVTSLSPDASAEERSVAMAKAIGVRAILDWEGVVDEDDSAMPVSPEAVDALMDFYPAFEAFQVGYVAAAMQLHLEKKGSAPSPNGGSAGARRTATPAPRRAKAARKSKAAH